MTTAQDQQSRVEFEAHMRKLSPCARLYRHTCDGGDKYRTVTVQRNWELWQAARALPADMEPVTGQCRFAGDLEWRPCAVEHVRMVLAAPQDWEGYEVRCLYVAAPLPPAAQKRYRLLVRNVDTIQADDEFLRDAASTWQIDPQGIFVGMPYMSHVLLPARRAIEPTP